MLKKFPYPRSLIALIVLSLVSAWLVYAGSAPLLVWVVLIGVQVGIVLLAAKAFVGAADATTSPSVKSIKSGAPESLVKAVEYANERSDAVGQRTPFLPAGLSSLMGERARDLASQVRAYASVEDAKSYGWKFYEEIGLFNAQPICRLAVLDGQEWEYDGLMGASHTAAVPSDRRVFGRLRYKQVNSGTATPSSANNGAPAKSSSNPVSAEDTDAQGVASL